MRILCFLSLSARSSALSPWSETTAGAMPLVENVQNAGSTGDPQMSDYLHPHATFQA
ncbi:MAG: hypothetical protein ACTHLP_12620 [Rhizobiaceae bacterium]